MKPVKLINLVKGLFPEATVTIAVADPYSPESSHLVCFSAYGTGVCIDCSDDGYSIYDNVGDDELHLSFKDLLHVLPFICRCLDSGKPEPELPQYDDFCRQKISALFSSVRLVLGTEHNNFSSHKDGFYRFWNNDFVGWSKYLTHPANYAHGCNFISVATGDIFEAVGGTEYDGATAFKKVGLLPHFVVPAPIASRGWYSL